ncbi:hypothetical protein ACSL103130_08765 [Actinomyces slackii]|uniref:Uncharacterized protein n=1 Tax=Actinomyces slackii TaxID=52774 RepID=A0A448KBR3_9ACTO|nr:hypothetical protein [Actinomyces slackii]VEG74330.1 Uncharacterised protein [Actinomyces slackii]
MSVQEAEELCVSGMEEAPPLTVAQAQKLSGKDVYVCGIEFDEAGRVSSISVTARSVPDPTVEADPTGDRWGYEEFLAHAVDGDMPSACWEHKDGTSSRVAIIDDGQIWWIRVLACDHNREPPPTFPWE